MIAGLALNNVEDCEQVGLQILFSCIEVGYKSKMGSYSLNNFRKEYWDFGRCWANHLFPFSIH